IISAHPVRTSHHRIIIAAKRKKQVISWSLYKGKHFHPNTNIQAGKLAYLYLVYFDLAYI
ncbi:UNVERIFIED_CONTAM: hypothetical protein NY100_10065, partial [Prevotella sp. 15_C9]